VIIVNLKNIKPMNVDEVLSRLEQKYPGEKEYLQAVKEVLVSIEEVYNAHPEFEKAKLIERLVEPERIITFRRTNSKTSGGIGPSNYRRL